MISVIYFLQGYSIRTHAKFNWITRKLDRESISNFTLFMSLDNK